MSPRLLTMSPYCHRQPLHHVLLILVVLILTSTSSTETSSSSRARSVLPREVGHGSEGRTLVRRLRASYPSLVAHSPHVSSPSSSSSSSSSVAQNAVPAFTSGNRVSRSAFNDPPQLQSPSSSLLPPRPSSSAAAVAAGAVDRARRSTSSPQLVINPHGNTHRIQKGKAFVLSCLGSLDGTDSGSYPDLFTDLEWFDPNGQRIVP